MNRSRTLGVESSITSPTRDDVTTWVTARARAMIAEAARRRFPEPIVPTDLVEPFEEMARLCLEMCERIVAALRSSELEHVEDLDRMDDRVDELKSVVVDRVVAEDGPDVVNAVDVALLGRYFERYADQIVDVASRIVFFVSGRKN